MALFSYEGWLLLLRWFHFLAGIAWIGMLYYFNFVQTPFFASTEAPVRTGMIAGITGAISDMKTGIRDARASVAPDERGHIEVTVEVFDVKHLDRVISSIKGVPGVLDVERLQGAA